MWQRQMFVFSIFVLLTPGKAASESRFNGDTSGRELNNGEQQLQVNLNAWQPLRGPNNWLILQATAATSMHRHRQQQQQQQEEREREREQQQHRLPVNYYAYNHRYNPRSNTENSVAAGGNYKQVRPDLSYVLAISQTMRRGLPGDIQADADADEDEEEASPRHQLTPPALKDVQEVDMRVGGQEVRRADDFVALTNAPADDVVNGLVKPSLPAATTAAVLDVDNYLAPFEQAVVKVRNFCDTLRSLISVDDDDATMEMETETETEMETETEEQQEQQEQAQSERLPGGVANAANKLDGRASWATSKEVQGRSSRQQAVSSPNEGRKLKKLKKKIQKLLLPLLIAYKLKFLTLIPVLIGGLTLLVGTTGLAGFFFALFTAVMSLKTSTGAGHGSKAIVLKKI